MSRNRVIYQIESLLVGPSPSTGYHFVNYDGAFNNDYTNTSTNFNLVKSIYRVQDFNFGFEQSYTDITHLGKDSTVYRAIVNPGVVNVDFSYLQQGVVNELRCGFYSNYTQIYGNTSGLAFYPNNTGVNLLSGFIVRTLEPGNNEVHYPYNYRDKRNLFAVMEKEGRDVNPTSYAELHNNARNLSVMGFGNCYLTRYNAQASVGSFPTCSMSWVGENMSVYLSGSGVPIPAVDYTTRSGINNKHFNVPADYQGDSAISCIRPGDITLDITCLSKITNMLAIQGTGTSAADYPDIYNLGFSYSDIKIQSYNLDLPLTRENLSSIGHKLPIDRPLVFPIFASLDIEAIVGDSQTGSLSEFMKHNNDYNLKIKLKNPATASNNFPNAVAVQYDLLRSKLEKINYTNQIGGQKSVNMSFRTEIDPYNVGQRGLYISGLLNIEPLGVLYGRILKEDGDFLLQENGDKILAQQISPLF